MRGGNGKKKKRGGLARSLFSELGLGGRAHQTGLGVFHELDDGGSQQLRDPYHTYGTPPHLLRHLKHEPPKLSKNWRKNKK